MDRPRHGGDRGRGRGGGEHRPRYQENRSLRAPDEEENSGIEAADEYREARELLLRHLDKVVRLEFVDGLWESKNLLPAEVARTPYGVRLSADPESMCLGNPFEDWDKGIYGKPKPSSRKAKEKKKSREGGGDEDSSSSSSDAAGERQRARWARVQAAMDPSVAGLTPMKVD